MEGELSCARRGWVSKSHRGKPFAQGSSRRYLVVEGFHVEYFADAAMRLRKGKFDLRNVLNLRPSTDPDCSNGVDIHLSESREINPTQTKTVSLSFGDQVAFASWMELLSSAVVAKSVDPSIVKHRSEPLATAFNAQHAQQRPRCSSLSTRSIPLLSPRRKSGHPGSELLADEPQLEGARGSGSERWSCMSESSAESSMPPSTVCPVFELRLSADALPPPPPPPPPPPEGRELTKVLSVNSAIRDSLERADPHDYAEALGRTSSDEASIRSGRTSLGRLSIGSIEGQDLHESNCEGSLSVQSAASSTAEGSSY